MRRLAALAVLVAIIIVGAMPSLALGYAPASRISSVVFTDATRGYITGGYNVSGFPRFGFVSSTIDGGKTWQPYRAANAYFVGASALGSPASAFVVSTYRTDIWSRSGGVWSLIPAAVSSAPAAGFADVEQVSTSTAYAVGQHLEGSWGEIATIWRTTDGGQNWAVVSQGPQITVPDPQNPGATMIQESLAKFNAIDASDDLGTLFAVGPIAATPDPDSEFSFTSVDSNWIAKSVDGGSTWTTSTVSAPAAFTSVSVVSSTTAFAVGSKYSYCTTNGVDWRPLRNNTRAVSDNALYDTRYTSGTSISTVAYTGVAAFSANKVALVGYPASTTYGYAGRVAVSVDGGATWKFWSFPTEYRLNAVAWLDATHLVVAGDGSQYGRLTIDGSGNVIAATTAYARYGAYPRKTYSLAITTPTSTTSAVTVKVRLRDSGGHTLRGRPIKIEYSSDDRVTWKSKTVYTNSRDSSGYYGYWRTSIASSTYYRASYYGYSATSTALAYSARKLVTHR